MQRLSVDEAWGTSRVFFFFFILGKVWMTLLSMGLEGKVRGKKMGVGEGKKSREVLIFFFFNF